MMPTESHQIPMTLATPAMDAGQPVPGGGRRMRFRAKKVVVERYIVVDEHDIRRSQWFSLEDDAERRADNMNKNQEQLGNGRIGLVHTD